MIPPDFQDLPEAPPLLSGLRLGACFSPKRVQVGQWFTRLEYQGQPLPVPVRARVSKIEIGPAGKFFTLIGARKMGVCAHYLKTDFARIVSDKDAAPWTGDEVAESTPPATSKRKKPYYED